MYRGTDDFVRILNQYKDTRPILVYGDPDVDGLFTLFLMCQFCEMLGLKYKYYVNENRGHGFLLDPAKVRGHLVISGDFAIDSSKMQELVDNDIVVLSTDHHETESEYIHIISEKTGAEGIHINNQYPFEAEEDRYLSGAGVWYELICSIYPEFTHKDRATLVGITLLSDARAIENPKARQYLRTAYIRDTSTGYLHYLIENTLGKDFSYGVPRLDRNFIDFTLSPTINAMLRYNKTKEAIDFVLGKGLSAESLQCKNDQKELMSRMANFVHGYNLSNLNIIKENSEDFPNENLTNFIGLYCGKYKEQQGGISTIGFVTEIINGVETVTRASFRGRFDDINYQQIFLDLGVRAAGHKGAFGIKNFQPTPELYEQLNAKIFEAEQGHKLTNTVIDTMNLAVYCNTRAQKDSEENCFVRDMFRTYVRYTGQNAMVIKETYKYEPLTQEEIQKGIQPDMTSKGVQYKYALDSNGERIRKYIEYSVDGRQVKSFGTDIYKGIILPIKERGHVQFYVHEPLIE